MHALVLYAHPNPASFNHAILEATEETLRKKGYTVAQRDLNALGFDPILKAADFVALGQGKVPEDIAREQELVRAADLLVVIHPIWWFGMPAVLKGWVDRVFTHGFAYSIDAKGVEGLLKGKKVILLHTTGGPAESFQSTGYDAAVRATIDQGVFAFCGMEVALHRFFYAVPSITAQEREKMLVELRQSLHAALG